MARLLGIDLWTSNSFTVVIEGGKPARLDRFGGARTTPFVVVFIKTGESKLQMNMVKGPLGRIVAALRSDFYYL